MITVGHLNKNISHKEGECDFVLWYRNMSFRGITVMCEAKYLNKCYKFK